MESPYVQIVTGSSGAGKTTVLKTLEDNGFFCVDNLPIDLLPAFIENNVQKNCYEKIALGIDVRNSSSLDSLVQLLPNLQRNATIKIIFLTASTAHLLKRFQETRRKHPLANGITLLDAIDQEKAMLHPLLGKANVVIDTGNLTVHQLRMLVKNSCAQLDTSTMVINLISFGFKYGVPQECNYVYDLRSLSNPHFVEELRPLTGLDASVQNYLFDDTSVQEYWKKLQEFIRFSIEKACGEGRFFMHIALGCTGGKHRSVAFVEALAKTEMTGVLFVVSHRDIDKEK